MKNKSESADFPFSTLTLYCWKLCSCTRSWPYHLRVSGSQSNQYNDANENTVQYCQYSHSISLSVLNEREKGDWPLLTRYPLAARGFHIATPKCISRNSTPNPPSHNCQHIPKEYIIKELKWLKCHKNPLTLDTTRNAVDGFCASLTGSGSGIKSSQLSSSSSTRLAAGTFFSLSTCSTFLAQSSHNGYCSSRSSLCQLATCRDCL